MFSYPNLTARAAVIESILARLDELSDPLTKNGEKGNGDQPPQMPGTYTSDVREVESLLGRLRSEERRLWWHVSERYLRSSQTTKSIKVKRRVPKKKGWITEDARIVVTTESPLVQDLLVAEGLLWMAERWSLRHEPMFPVVKDRGHNAVFPPSQTAA